MNFSKKIRFIAVALWALIIVFFALHIDKILKYPVTYVSNEIGDSEYKKNVYYKFDTCYNNVCSLKLSLLELRQVLNNKQLRYFNSASGNFGNIELVLTNGKNNGIIAPNCDSNSEVAGYYLVDTTGKTNTQLGYFNKQVFCPQLFGIISQNIKLEYYDIKQNFVYAILVGDKLNIVSATQGLNDMLIGTPTTGTTSYQKTYFSDQAIIFNSDYNIYKSILNFILGTQKIVGYQNKSNIKCLAKDYEKDNILTCSQAYHELFSLIKALVIWLTIPILIFLVLRFKSYIYMSILYISHLTIRVRTVLFTFIFYLLGFTPVLIQIVLSTFLSALFITLFFTDKNENRM
jgi:hypothetical protein